MSEFHLRDIRENCSETGCHSRASKGVYSRAGACMGRYCLPHAKARLWLLNSTLEADRRRTNDGAGAP